MKKLIEPCDRWCNAPFDFCKQCVLCWNKELVLRCKECNETYLIEENDDMLCPNCGAKVVEK